MEERLLKEDVVRGERKFLYKMLKRIYRLPPKTKLNKNDSLSTKFYRLIIAENGLPYSRVGFVISKKVDKKAVIRNRIRRKMTNSVEKIIGQFRVGYDMLFILGKEAALSIDQLEGATLELFKKKGLLA